MNFPRISYFFFFLIIFPIFRTVFTFILCIALGVCEFLFAFHTLKEYTERDTDREMHVFCRVKKCTENDIDNREKEKRKWWKQNKGKLKIWMFSGMRMAKRMENKSANCLAVICESNASSNDLRPMAARNKETVPHDRNMLFRLEWRRMNIQSNEYFIYLSFDSVESVFGLWTIHRRLQLFSLDFPCIVPCWLPLPLPFYSFQCSFFGRLTVIDARKFKEVAKNANGNKETIKTVMNEIKLVGLLRRFWWSKFPSFQLS